MNRKIFFVIKILNSIFYSVKQCVKKKNDILLSFLHCAKKLEILRLNVEIVLFFFFCGRCYRIIYSHLIFHYYYDFPQLSCRIDYIPRENSFKWCFVDVQEQFRARYLVLLHTSYSNNKFIKICQIQK